MHGGAYGGRKPWRVEPVEGGACGGVGPMEGGACGGWSVWRVEPVEG